MIRKEELNQFTKNELIDILLSKAIYPFVERHLNYLIEEKNEAKLNDIDKEIYLVQKEKEDYFKSLKEKYHTDNDKEVISKMDLEEKIKFIHIAGTNGKGSCTEMISNILVCAGYKVGKVISPHLIKYNERMVIKFLWHTVLQSYS